MCGRSYIKDYLEYVCVNEIGDLIKPHYVTESFPKLLKAKDTVRIRPWLGTEPTLRYIPVVKTGVR